MTQLIRDVAEQRTKRGTKSIIRVATPSNMMLACSAVMLASGALGADISSNLQNNAAVKAERTEAKILRLSDPPPGAKAVPSIGTQHQISILKRNEAVESKEVHFGAFGAISYILMGTSVAPFMLGMIRKGDENMRNLAKR